MRESVTQNQILEFPSIYPQEPFGSRADSGLVPEGVGVGMGVDVATRVGVVVGVGVSVGVGVNVGVDVLVGAEVAVALGCGVLVDAWMSAN